MKSWDTRGDRKRKATRNRQEDKNPNTRRKTRLERRVDVPESFSHARVRRSSTSTSLASFVVAQKSFA